MVPRWALVGVLTFLAACHPSSDPVMDASLPAWVATAVAERQRAASWGSIYEASYRGERVFLLLGDREDQTLVTADGREICRFGGLVGAVMSGACDVSDLRAVRTLYKRERR